MSAVASEVSERVVRTCGLDAGVESLRYVSGKRQEALERLGIRRVRDLLLHLPHRYLDFSRAVPISFADVGNDVTVIGKVQGVSSNSGRSRVRVVTVDVADDTGILRAVFFRQPWIEKQLKAGDMVALSGTVTFSGGFKQMRSPFFEKSDDHGSVAHFARVLPVHPVGEGISGSWMRRIVSAALSDAGDVCDPVPAAYVARLGLMSEARALREVHFPTSVDSAEEARRRLAYDELLCLQLAILVRQRIDTADALPFEHATDGPRLDALRRALPFSLNIEQEQATHDILQDMAAHRIMNRLLLGDVGTGKTAVALMAVAVCADTGTQAAMMAPTSVLARQYAEKLGPYLHAAGISWTLLVGATSPAERRRAVAGVRDGTTCCVFGTTALLSDDVEFARLSLVVIDEQHRFGVGQRAALRQKGAAADLLAMTATPIPRTLALSVYGDLDCSRIHTRPRVGAGIDTKVLPPENLDIALGAIREAVAAGQQAYVVCPLVDERDDGSELDDVPERSQSATQHLHAATTTLRSLSQSGLKGATLGLLTGRMRAEEKDRAMERFRSGETDVLVATTVVEVGVDVPNATVMLVFDADRFGLAALHQLRGRVGRGDKRGMVYLCCAAKPGTAARERLDALEATSDGFILAELDLKLRREGEVLGYRQHGDQTLRICDLHADADLVEAAYRDARELVRGGDYAARRAATPLTHECRARYRAYFEEVERA